MYSVKRIVFTCALFWLSFSQAATCDYLQELSIRCLQRELTEQEIAYFPECSDTLAVRTAFSYFMLEQEDFVSRADLILRMELLQGATMDDIREAIQDFDLIAFSQPDHTTAAKKELTRLYNLYKIPRDYMEGKLTIADLYKINFDNWMYDQQNMGLNNFINSTFLYATGRPPTKSEFDNSYAMLTGTPGKLMFQSGSTREDYFRILMTNENFLEKQIYFWYYYFLFTYPERSEVYEIMNAIHQSDEGLNLESIIRYIIVHKLNT